jgi:plasmid stabilization system protein ParE
VRRRFLLSPDAAQDLVDILRYLKKEGSQQIADRVEATIRAKFKFLADFPQSGHRRTDLTGADVRFFSVYSYLIVYSPDTKPLQIVSIIHGNRDVSKMLIKLV